MHEAIHEVSFSIWTMTAFIFGAVVISKLLAKKTQSVDVLWLIVAGAILGNVGLLPSNNHALEYIGEIGIVFIMFALGFEENLENFVEGLKKSLGVAIIGAIFPFIAGYMSASMFGFSHNSAMVWGLTMTATAVSLTMMSLKNTGMNKTKAATGIMTAAVVDDVLSLIGVAILIPIILIGASGAEDGKAVNMLEILWIIAKVFIFFAVIIVVGLFAFPDKKMQNYVPIRKWERIIRIPQYFYQQIGLNKFFMLHKGEYLPLFVIFIAFSMGAFANELGFHPAIGAYFAGLFMKEDYFLEKTDSEQKEFQSHLHIIHKFIDNIAFTVFGPIFFVNLGTKLVFDIEILSSALPIVLTLFILVLVFQVLSAGLAAKYTGGYENHDSVLIGLGMLGRAELAFIVINIAYVQNKIISTEEFYTLIFTAFLLNISVPLLIKMWQPYYSGEKEFKLLGIKLSK